MEEKVINGKVFRLVYLRGRGKWIAKDGEAYNPIHFNQRATVHMNPDGYPCFGGGVPVHLYVANAWVDGKFDGAEVDHIDYNRLNYHADNLRWMSHVDNVQRSSINHIGVSSGNRNGRAVFSQEEVIAIKEMYKAGMKTMEIIKKLHPDYTFNERKALWNRFNRIKTGETWIAV